MHETPRHERGRALALDDVRRVLLEHSLRVLGDAVVVPVDAQVLRGQVPAQRPSDFVRGRRVPRRDVVLRVEQALLGRHAVQIRLVLRGSQSGAHGVGGALAVSGRDACAFTAPRVFVRETRRVGSVRVSNTPRLVARASRFARACVRARARSQLRPTRAASEGKSIPRQCANFRSGFARLYVTKNSFAANPMAFGSTSDASARCRNFEPERFGSGTTDNRAFAPVEFSIAISIRSAKNEKCDFFLSTKVVRSTILLCRFLSTPHHLALLPDRRRRR